MGGKLTTPTPKGISDRGPSKKTPKTKPIEATAVNFRSKSGAERSVSIREIENGFLVSESSFDRKGRYKSTERYCKEPPLMHIRGTTKNRKY